MIKDYGETVLTTQEACSYLRISRPTYLKYIYLGRIKGTKAGKGWKVLRSELDRFLKGENEYPHQESAGWIVKSEERTGESFRR
jgi:excisionase family DNA binding protein